MATGKVVWFELGPAAGTTAGDARLADRREGDTVEV
jgi:hypothetical protein